MDHVIVSSNTSDQDKNEVVDSTIRVVADTDGWKVSQDVLPFV